MKAVTIIVLVLVFLFIIGLGALYVWIRIHTKPARDAYKAAKSAQKAAVSIMGQVKGWDEQNHARNMEEGSGGRRATTADRWPTR